MVRDFSVCMHVCGPAVSERGLRISASVSKILGDTYTPLELKWCIQSMPFFSVSSTCIMEPEELLIIHNATPFQSQLCMHVCI